MLCMHNLRSNRGDQWHGAVQRLLALLTSVTSASLATAVSSPALAAATLTPATTGASGAVHLSSAGQRRTMRDCGGDGWHWF